MNEKSGVFEVIEKGWENGLFPPLNKKHCSSLCPIVYSTITIFPMKCPNISITLFTIICPILIFFFLYLILSLFILYFSSYLSLQFFHHIIILLAHHISLSMSNIFHLSITSQWCLFYDCSYSYLSDDYEFIYL